MNEIDSFCLDRQLCAKLQYFYDFVLDLRSHLSNDVTVNSVAIEKELDKLIDELTKVFSDIIYTNV